jgi:putative intracellular protease/amidase
MSVNRRKFLAGAAAAAPLLMVAAGSTARAQEEVPALDPEADHIGMLIYPGFTALDFMGPHHFLGGMPRAKIHVVTTQRDLSPVASDLGLLVQPTTTMDNCPADLALIFVPGGTVGTVAAAADPDVVAFVRDRASRARYVTSVCTGSLILGAAGLLEGKRATSHWATVPLLEQFGATPISERVVRDGNLITGAGVSAGLDFGITVVEEMHGRMVAEAGVLISEYAPQPPIDGGTLDTARPEIAALLQNCLAGFVEQARGLTIL